MKFVYSTGARPLDGYTIKRGIGIGGFGEVYFATSDGGKEVALKRIQRNLDIELRGVRQCLNLKHINLIDLYDIRYDAEGGAWVVMEFVAGESLKEVLDRNPNGLPNEEIDRWFTGIAEGVSCLHDHGIVHRDLKPGNIFSDHETVKIGDYGLSKFISCSRRSGQTESVGTFHYMAPEIGKGVYGKEIDVYAVGIILFELLTGRVPFDGESSQEIIMKHLTADPDLGEIREPHRSLVRRAMHKDPDKRFKSMQDMLHAYQGKPLVSETRQSEPLVVADIDHSPAGELTEPKPPVRPGEGGGSPEMFYITEEGAGDDMVFGPVRQGANPAPPARPQRQPVAGLMAAASRPASPTPHPLSGYTTALKIGLLVVGCMVAAINPSTLIIALVVVGGALLFYGGRMLATAGAEQGAWYKEQADQRKEARRCLFTARSRKPFSESMSDLIGSLLFSAAAAAVVSLLAVSLADLPLEGSVQTWSIFLWLTLVTTLGAWLVQVAGKVWECHEGDSVVRRFVMLCAGLGLGIAAFGGAQFLNVQFQSGMPVVDVSPLTQFTAWYADGQPRLPAYLAYFAGIFGVLRWWTQVDPLRPARLSLVATALCVLWAWVLHTVFYFPQPWGVVMAGTISVAAQLAGPWLTTQDRSQIQQDYQEAVS